MDLTCKLAAYGIYLGFIIDGDSRMVLHATVMPDKTALRVYEELLRPALSLWAFPDQLVTDQGEEWRLCIFVCFFVWWVSCTQCAFSTHAYERRLLSVHAGAL